MSADRAPEQRTAVGLLAALYVWEAAALGLAMAGYKYSNRLGSLNARQWAWIVGPAVAFVASAAYIIYCSLQSRRSARRWFLPTVALNLLPVTIMLVAGEMAVRIFAVPTPLGPSVAGTLLLPRNWDQVRARNADLLKHAPSNISYFVSDDLLGWTLGPSRRSTNGLYLSSAEGIRSGRQGAVYAGRAARYRIATVGDSYTFGLEVPFENSWGNVLERALGPGVEVLNFGVDGYGVDQAYLRYHRDVRPWRPRLVIFGFINHDLYRTLSVYTFLTFPDFGIPFSKPHFVLNAGTPTLVNVPLISPADIRATPSVERLPFIEDEPGYEAAEWQRHFYHASYLVRFLVSRFPRWPSDKPAPDVERINSALLLQFVREATEQGSVPLVVYFPSRSDFEDQDRSAKAAVLATLRQSGVDLVDMTPCISAVGEAKAFIPGRPHYSAAGNAAVADCLVSVVRKELRRQ